MEIKKRQYVSPEIMVIKVNHQSPLLKNSVGLDNDTDDDGDPLTGNSGTRSWNGVWEEQRMENGEENKYFEQ